MNTNLWKYRLIGVGVVCVGRVPSFGVQAECGTCNRPPEVMRTYFEVMDELLIPLPTVDAESTEQAIQNASDRYKRASEIAKIHLQDVAAQLERSYEGDEIQLLEQTAVVNRDYQRLLEIDKKILQELGLFAAVFSPTDTIFPADKAAAIDALFARLEFVRLARDDTGFVLEQESVVTYYGMLRRLNGLMKHLHLDKNRYHTDLYDIGKGSVKTMTKEAEDTKKAAEREQARKVYKDLVRLTNANVTRFEGSRSVSDSIFTFPEDHRILMLKVWELQSDYECSIGVRSLCESWRLTAESSRERVRDRWQNDGKRASDTFLTALGRLQGSLGFGDEDDKESAARRQEQLTQQYRGNDLPQKEKRRIAEFHEDVVEGSPTSVTNLVKRIFESRKDLSEIPKSNSSNKVSNSQKPPLSSVPLSDSIAGKNDNDNRADSTEDKKAIIDEYYYGYFDKDDRRTRDDGSSDFRSYLVTDDLQREKRAIQASVLQVLTLQSTMQTNALVSDVRSVTTEFPNLSDALTTNEDLRGDKHDAGGVAQSIYVSAQKICRAQCSNLDADKICGALGP